MPKEFKADLAQYGDVVITGGSAGIGKVFVNRILSMHPHMRICNLSRRDATPALSTAILHNFTCDLAKPADRKGALERLRAFLGQSPGDGKLLIINNSGFGVYGPFGVARSQRTIEMLEVNNLAMVEVTARLWPLLESRGGAIINVASTAAFQPLPGLAAYAASKAFVLHWSIALRQEVREHGLYVQALCPGPTLTDFFDVAGVDTAQLPKWLYMTPERVVDASLRGMHRRKAVVICGRFNRLLAATGSRLPKAWVAALMARMLRKYRPLETSTG